jgi:Trk K+ transport system NAD-binding subunit
MRVRAARGAIVVPADTREAIGTATQRLLTTVLERNSIDADDLVSILFTATDDLRAGFPAEGARASEQGTAERLERAGANRVVSPFVSSGRQMVRMAVDPSRVDLFDETTRSIAVEERVVGHGDDLDGVPVGDVPVAVLAVRRADGSTLANPSPDTALGAGDVVLLLER